MKITFTHQKKKGEISVFGACEVKYYAVAKDYSDDGFYASVWLAQELEPVPACAVADTTLLAHVRIVAEDSGDFAVQEVFCMEGVKYAKN